MCGAVPRLSPAPSWRNEGKLHLFHCMSRGSAYNRRRVSKISISEAAAYNPDYRRSINGRVRGAFFQGETLAQQPARHATRSADMQKTNTPYPRQERGYSTDCKTPPYSCKRKVPGLRYSGVWRRKLKFVAHPGVISHKTWLTSITVYKHINSQIFPTRRSINSHVCRSRCWL